LTYQKKFDKILTENDFSDAEDEDFSGSGAKVNDYYFSFLWWIIRI